MPTDSAMATPFVNILAGETTAKIESGIGLCLSGGGYRSMLFQVGVLWRLNEFGYLPKIDRISSVSGGSITAAVLGMNWEKLKFNSQGISAEFDKAVVQPIRKMAGIGIDIKSTLSGIFSLDTVNEKVEKAYEQYLFNKTDLQTLPDKPRFVINATNVQSGVLWRFMKPYMRDYRVGEVKKPKITLAKAVAASSAFPPFLSPATLKFKPNSFAPKTGTDLQTEPFISKVKLSDGGVYDNLGVEAVFKRYKTVLVSDAGGKLKPEEKPKTDWPRHIYRVLDLIDNQVRSLRKRILIEAYKNKERSGAYWGIRTDIKNYNLNTSLDCPYDKTIKLADTSTRLDKLDSLTQERIINWGYAVCDAAMRTHVDKSLPVPVGFAYPASGIG